MNNKWKKAAAVLAGISGIIFSILAWFNLANRNRYKMLQEQVSMYGCLRADYDVTILVCTEEGEPIPGIKVSNNPLATQELQLLEAMGGQQNTSYDKDDSCFSDPDGEVKITFEDVIPEIFTLNFVDVDGSKNLGDFQTRNISKEELDLKKTKKGEGAWDEGNYSVTGRVVMKLKDKEE